MSICLKVSGVATSGTGAPSRLTTPLPMRPRSARLPGVRFGDCSSSCISGADVMMRSAGKPDWMMARSWPVVPMVKSKVWPLWRE